MTFVQTGYKVRESAKTNVRTALIPGSVCSTVVITAAAKT